MLYGDPPSENLWHFCGTHDIKVYGILPNDNGTKNSKSVDIIGLYKILSNDRK